jgi:hypothetical protein
VYGKLEMTWKEGIITIELDLSKMMHANKL